MDWGIEEKDGATRWARIAELGPGTEFQLHVLLGGRDNTRRYRWMVEWEELTGGSARSRRLVDADKLRGTFNYLVQRRNCGFRSHGVGRGDIHFAGWSG